MANNKQTDQTTKKRKKFQGGAWSFEVRLLTESSVQRAGGFRSGVLSPENKALKPESGSLEALTRAAIPVEVAVKANYSRNYMNWQSGCWHCVAGLIPLSLA